MIASSPWWTKAQHEDRRPLLIARGRIKSAIRAWFEAQNFIEVEPACLQVSPGNETHVHAFKTEHIDTDLSRRALYLHTSPEFAMKKLLAAGEEKIFAFAPVFRNRERGPLHACEFTMLEWYRAGAPYEQLWSDCAAILKIAATITGRDVWSFRDRACDVQRDCRRVTVDDAFIAHAHIALRDARTSEAIDRDRFASLAGAQAIRVSDDATWSDIFSQVLAEKIEPHLGAGEPVILSDYPLREAALARPSAREPSLAERFELYVCGVELANGFGELTDAGEQRRRFETWMADKQRIYGERYPIDDDFLAALAQMPPASGCALGFDRLVMLATGAQRLDQVIWTPQAAAGKQA